MFNVVFGLVMLLLVLAFVGIGLLKGRKYTWVYSALRTLAVLVAAPLSVLLAVLAAEGLAALGLTVLNATGVLGTWAGLLEEVPTLKSALKALVAMTISPVCFYLIFAVLRPVLNAIAKAVTGAITAKKRPNEAEQLVAGSEKPMKNAELRVAGKNPMGMLFGALCGLVLCLTLTAPLVGVLAVADETVGLIDEYSDEPEVETAAPILDAAANNPGSKTVRLLGGQLMYDHLTSARVGGETLTLNKELRLVCAAANAVSDTKNTEVPRQEAAESIRQASVAFRESVLVPALAPELLDAADAAWDRGETYHGIAKPSFGEELNTLTDPLLEILASSDRETLKDDVDSVARILATLVEKDALGQIKNDPMALLSNTEITEGVLCVLLENDRMRPLVGAVAEYGISVMAKKMNMLASRATLYEDFISDAAEILSSEGSVASVARLANGQMKANYQTLFDRYGLEVSEASIETIADQTSLYFAEQPMTEETLKTFFAEQTLVMKSGASFAPASQEAMLELSLLVSCEDIYFDSSVITKEEAAGEAKALANVLSELASLSDSIQGEIDAADTVRKMGSVLDALAATKTVGKEETEQLLTGLFQSKTVREQIGCSVLEATEITVTVSEQSKTNGYAPLMNSLGNTVEVVQKSAGNENIGEQMDTLLADLTPESAAVLRTMSKPGVMIKHGVPERSAEASSGMFSSMFGNLADAKASGMSDEEYAKESKAAADMTNLAIKMSAGNTENIFGEDSVTGVSAEEYVGNMLDSTVICKTMVDTVYADGSSEPVMDPINTQKTLSEAEQTEFLEVLNTHWERAEQTERADEEYRKNYIAMGAMLNIELTVTEDGITLAD